MHCDGCVRRVRKILERAGVAATEVVVGSATVEAPPAELAKAIATLASEGYPATQNGAPAST
jgi:copper chaperone CopZ